MNGATAIRVPIAEAASLARLRSWHGIEVISDDQYVWVRIPEESRPADGDRERGDRVLLAIPGCRFTILADGQLVPAGKLVPQGRIPDGTWCRLHEWITLEPPVALLGGTVAERASLKLVRARQLQPSGVLITKLPVWRDYVASAAAVRLERWSFAADDRGLVVVRGTPLPPIPGTRYVEAHGVACPAGWTWTPAVDAAIVAKTLSIESGDLALLQVGGGWDHIPADRFVRATRSSVRLTAEEFVSHRRDDSGSMADAE